MKKRNENKKHAKKANSAKKAGNTGAFLRSIIAPLSRTFRTIDRRYLLVALYDLLLVTFSIGVLFLMSYIMKAVLGSLSIPATEAAALQASSMMYLLLLVVILAYAAIIYAFSIVSIRVWSIFAGTKFKFKGSWKFFLVNMLWVFAWIAVIYAIAQSLKFNLGWFLFAVYLLLLLCTHFTFVLLYAYAAEGNIKPAFKKLVDVGIKRLHHFTAPLLILLVVLLAIMNAVYYIVPYISELAGSLLTNTLLLVFALWARFYYAEVIRQNYGNAGAIRAGKQKVKPGKKGKSGNAKGIRLRMKND